MTKEFKSFLSWECADYSKIKIILDTSSILYAHKESADGPTQLSRMVPFDFEKVEVIIPRDVYFEVKHLYLGGEKLSGGTVYRLSRNLLELVESQKIRIASFSLRDFYYGRRSSFVENDTAYVVLFFSQLAAVEFQKNSIRAKNIFVCIQDQGKAGCQHILPVVWRTPFPIEEYNEIFKFECKEVYSQSSKMNNLQHNLNAVDADGNEYKLIETNNQGGEACIYEIVGDQERIAKIFKMSCSAEKETKINHLIQHNNRLKNNACMPQILLYNPETKEVIGFIMRKVVGRTLEEVLNVEPNIVGGILNDMIRDLIILHIFDILVKDFRFCNIMVNSDNFPEYIDSDSFQYKEFAGFGRNEEMLHKELICERGSNILFSVTHDVFAFLVMYFIACNKMHPLSQIPEKKEDINELSFGNFVCPFSIAGQKNNINVPEFVKFRWNYMKTNFQDWYNFCVETFNFERASSLGDLLYVLNKNDKNYQ